MAKDRIATFMAELEGKQIEYLRFELPDMHGVSRSKTVPIDKVEAYARSGLNFYGGVLGLDTSSNVVPASGLHGDRAFADQALFPDPESLRIIPWLEKTASVLSASVTGGMASRSARRRAGCFPNWSSAPTRWATT